MKNESVASRLISLTGLLIISTGLIFYFLPFMTMSPEVLNESLDLNYLDFSFQNNKPFRHFTDNYGPLTWLASSSIYALSGKQVLGISISLLILKLISIGLTYSLVKRMGGRFYALFTIPLMAVLLGQPWDYFQRTPSFFFTLPLFLASVWVLLTLPSAKINLRMSLSGLLTALVFCSKQDTGLFLLAGSLFYCFFWISFRDDQFTRYSKPSSPKLPLYLQIGVLFLYGVLFFRLIHFELNKVNFFYLILPQLLLLGITIHSIWSHQNHPLYAQTFWKRLRSCVSFVLAFLGTLLVFFLAYGWENGMQYLHNATFLLDRWSDLSVSYPVFGLPGKYKNFNENYWLQFPWLVTLLMIVWLIAQQYSSDYPLPHRNKWNQLKPQWVGLWGISSAHAYVLISAPNEIHILQVILIMLPMLGVLLSYLENCFRYTSPNYHLWFRTGWILIFGYWMMTIFHLPAWDVL